VTRGRDGEDPSGGPGPGSGSGRPAGDGAEGVTFVLARLKGPTRRTLREAGVLDLIGAEHDYPTVRAAVQAAVQAAPGGDAAGEAGSRPDGEGEPGVP
jgi:hypothetical protein